MSRPPENIHTTFDKILARPDKENLLNQHSCVLWLTGLSGSGKTTIAAGLEKLLNEKGFVTQLLDGDNVRSGINNNIGFSEEDRIENIRRIAEVSKLFLNCGIITINCFVSPTREIRQQAREIIGHEDFHEIFIDTPLEICEQRDVKGLYKKARNGEIKDFTGIDAPFEHPIEPNLTIKTEGEPIENSINQLLNYTLPLVRK